MTEKEERLAWAIKDCTLSDENLELLMKLTENILGMKLEYEFLKESGKHKNVLSIFGLSNDARKFANNMILLWDIVKKFNEMRKNTKDRNNFTEITKKINILYGINYG